MCPGGSVFLKGHVLPGFNIETLDMWTEPQCVHVFKLMWVCVHEGKKEMFLCQFLLTAGCTALGPKPAAVMRVCVSDKLRKNPVSPRKLTTVTVSGFTQPQFASHFIQI